MIENKKAQTTAAKPATAPTLQTKPADAKDAGPKLTDIASAYIRKKDLFDRQHEALTQRIGSSKANMARIEAMMTKAELALSTLVAPSVKNDLVEPLAKDLLKLLPACDGYEVIGPVGAQQAITISFVEKGATEEEKLAGTKCRSITLVTKTDGNALGLRDYSKDTKKYSPGSIGFASGLNHPVVPVPEEATVKWLLDWVK